jgi:hypothetical protein
LSSFFILKSFQIMRAMRMSRSPPIAEMMEMVMMVGVESLSLVYCFRPETTVADALAMSSGIYIP